ncbi:MAG TPA: ParB/RepB/Spo0J family partition protein [Candidatus Aquicultor sp.]
MQKRGLGRGLESLIPTITHEASAPLLLDDEQAGRLQDIPITKIVPNPNQPRKTFDEESFDELLSSVKEHGLIQPVVVRPVGTLYELIVGERRWRAAKAAGLETVPALIRETSDIEAIELAIIENVQRQDLNALEEAAAYYHLVEDFDFTQEEIAQRVGKKRSTVANMIRLLRLPDAVKQMIVEGTLQAGHARTVLSLSTEELQIKLAERVVAGGLTVRQTEALAKLWQNPEKERKATPTPMHYRIKARDLSKQLSAKVKVKLQGEKGRVEIHFKSEVDLQRILGILESEK